MGAAPGARGGGAPSRPAHAPSPRPGCGAQAVLVPRPCPRGGERGWAGREVRRPFLPQSRALAGNNAARCSRGRPAPPTHGRPRLGPAKPSARPAVRDDGAFHPQRRQNRVERERVVAEEAGPVFAEGAQRNGSGSPWVLGSPGRLTATNPRRARPRAQPQHALLRLGNGDAQAKKKKKKSHKGRRFKGRDHIP